MVILQDEEGLKLMDENQRQKRDVWGITHGTEESQEFSCQLRQNKSSKGLAARVSPGSLCMVTLLGSVDRDTWGSQEAPASLFYQVLHVALPTAPKSPPHREWSTRGPPFRRRGSWSLNQL